MPPNGHEPRVQLSVLDRLLDDEPKKREETPAGRAQSLRQMKAAVRRDLEWLLNTRCIPEAAEEDLKEVPNSLYTYGLPDFSSFTVGSTQAKLRLQRALQHALENFEPRLMNVSVATIDDESAKDRRMLRFLISGLLRMDPAPEQVTFDTMLELTRGEYKVRED